MKAKNASTGTPVQIKSSSDSTYAGMHGQITIIAHRTPEPFDCTVFVFGQGYSWYKFSELRRTNK